MINNKNTMHHDLKDQAAWRCGRRLAALAVMALGVLTLAAADATNVPPAATTNAVAAGTNTTVAFKTNAPTVTNNIIALANRTNSASPTTTSSRSDFGPRGSSRRGEGSRGPSTPSSTNGLAAFDYNNFKAVFDGKNIFDPNRRPTFRPTGDVKPLPKVDWFALTGVISYEKGDFAIFDGSSYGFKQNLKSGGAIAGYTVSAISTNRVKLKKDDKEFDFPIGTMMRREDEGEWKQAQRSELVAATTSSAGATGSAPAAEPGSALERMLKRRAEEAAGKQ